ncbi:uncharacterized protein LOC128889196 isoform X1 [Hylaeus anthracinus]|uniref:uncharacterized protein LOC128889196 isoform X1 n=1 Tax=Hylaeus anthracinus TaxID=313031 RepID=UPI0023B89244|nr:uncharacterized protein LOC128889196 isoform X1 [Hylaeus anthracinus]
MGKTGSVSRDVRCIVDASRMMSRLDRLSVLLALLCIVGFVRAIYDPREATTKPPKRREPVLPWYSSDKDDVDTSEDLSRSPKWQTDPDNPIPRKPLIVNADTKVWSPWRKDSESGIDQRTEITRGSQSTINFDQERDFPLEYSQFEQQENQRFPGGSDGLEQRQDGDIKYKNKKYKTKSDQDIYEGIPADSTKPHKEKILLTSKSKSTVARYDAILGVQCPDLDSIGQFVYPPDCKFFVNCWKGRAFVQPCAPGTLFNPDTLECDFPHKVSCYGGAIADFPSNGHLESAGRREPLLPTSHSFLENERLQQPRCPPQMTGMLPHPTDCKKFLQCANGGTFIMDCGPGTVFNPAISVCDWPYNVKDCKDALKVDATPPAPPEYETFDYKKSEYHEHPPVKKVECPPDYTGLLPHPDTCKKFLQCANGITYIMDCGPGTAFNPSVSVCDWPYNVPGCSEEKSITTTIRPWSSGGSIDSGRWQHGRQHNQSYNHPPYSGQHPTTNRPGTDWDSLRPTWRPNWSTWSTEKTSSDWNTPRPPWNPGRWIPATSPGGHGHYEHVSHTNTRYGSNSPGEPNWNKEHDQIANSDLSQTHWAYDQGPNGQSLNYDGSYTPHHHHHHSNPHEPHGNTETQQSAPPFGHSQPQTPGHVTPGGSWHSGSGYQDHHQYIPDYHEGKDDSSQQTQQNPFDQTADRGIPGGGFDYSSSRSVGDEENLSNRRVGQEFEINRQGHGRTSPGFPQSGINQRPVAGGNVYVDSDYELPEEQDSTSTVNRQSARNRTTWTHSIATGGRVTPHSWSQQGPRQQVEPQNRPWDQGAKSEDKIQEWESRTNIYQSTADREADSKIDQLVSKTNIFESTKGRHQPGVKNSPNLSNPPNNIYVDINGTRGHFLTKEIEVNQGHSKTKTYGPNDLGDPSKRNGRDQNIYIDSQSTDFGPDGPFSGVPSVDRVLRPPYSGHRTSKQYPIDSPSASSGDLLGSDTNYHRVIVPSTNLQPPYYPPPSRSLTPPSSTNISRSNNYYPPVPSSDLQPPDYDPADTNYPPVPSTDLQPPNYDPTHTNYPPVPASDLQPPLQEFPSRSQDYPAVTSTNLDRYPTVSTDIKPPDRFLVPPSPDKSNTPNKYPSVPSRNLEPPIPPSSNPPTILPNFVSSSTQRVPDKHMIILKKVSRTLQKPSNKVSTTMDPNVPSVSIEYDERSSTTEDPDVPEGELDYEVDVLDEKEVWKPVLVFENKTQTTTESSVIMKITKKKADVDLINIEAPPFAEEEPPFPSYYVPPVEPIDHSRKVVLPTPISGQVIRLRGGSGPHDGYVEVQGTNPGWGIVCDSRNSWTLKEAHVVCKQLGYVRGAEMAWQGRNNHNGARTWIGANSVSCQGNETRFQLCKFTHEQECRIERDAIGVRCIQNRVAHCRKDEISHEGQCYHVADAESGLNHAEALDYCSKRQSRLVDITSQAENDFISELLVQGHPDVGSIMTSGAGFTIMGRTFWVWEDSSRAKFKFTKWWPGWMEDKKHTPIVGSRSLCVVLKRKFPCHDRPDTVCVADYFFWDTEDCATSKKGHSYICERPYDDIGCVYGKGSQYAGNANVTATGKQCLSWADERVRHPLAINVVNRELRDKLKVHNYCRNPNPQRETRPWCFTGPGGEREYCDIPACGNIGSFSGSQKSRLTGQCKPKHFECLPGECIPSPWVCDGEEDCTNGADEMACTSHIDLFKKYSKHKLEGYDVEKWLNTPLKTCALRCKEADFTCRSFTHKAAGNVCLLSDGNVGMTGALKPNREFDYYEMKERSVNCEGKFVCDNRKCINQTQVCNGKNDCLDRSDESICTVENLDYEIRLAGTENKHEGRVEVKILGVWGQVCDDSFGMIDADVICKELGFVLGALEVRPGGFYGNLDPPTRFMVDQLKCRGNETTLRECDFDGWGVHNCQPEEAVGIICKTAVNSCQDGHWKCDKSPTCIPTAFICDEVVDCPDKSDESSEHCDAPFEIRLANGSSPLEGRVEVRHHGIWGTVCDDDFSNAEATVICRSLGYGGPALAKKNGAFGAGEGPIWLDEVFCHGNETQLYRCEHNHWGQSNCNHDEDAGVICTAGDVNDPKLHWESLPDLPETNINDILPANCGKRFKDFNDDEDLIFAKVVHGTIAPKGTYPWQASIRVRGHSRSSHWCGAVVLSPLHVLTAAHCLEGYNKGTYFVRAGDYNTEIDEGTEAEANIEDYYIHEDFRKGHRMNNDIALVLLKGRGIFLGKDIMPICLPPENAEYPPGLNCTISGFGSIETGKSTHSKDLRYGWVPLLDQSVCRADHIYGEGAISDGMVCAGYLDEGIDTCDGDSGGPLACYHNGAFTLYGITSWGQHCGKANKPGVYVRISHYRRWIDQKIRESLAGR